MESFIIYLFFIIIGGIITLSIEQIFEISGREIKNNGNTFIVKGII